VTPQGHGEPAADADTVPWQGSEISGGTVLGPAVQARDIHGDVYLGTGPPTPFRMPVPAQLPPEPALFTGRSRELATLNGLLAGEDPARPVTIIALTGMPGVGKTTLATWWLRQVRSNYPDGELFADLGGHMRDAPVGPGEILAAFLRALNAPPSRPGDLEELAGAWRTATTGRRLIVLLDNAASAAQARALLPAGGPSLVVVTSRCTPSALALDGARFTRLGPLDEPAAAGLFGLVLGDDRAAADPGAARAVARLCGCLPLAVCVAGARHALSPWRTAAQIAGELASEQHRLASLTVPGDLSVRAAFDSSCQRLPPDAARMYRLASLLPAGEFSAEQAAAAAATDPHQAACLLDLLTEASLLDEEPASRRYRFHPLIRLHARGQAKDIEPAAEREAVAARCTGWRPQAAVAGLAVIPGSYRLSSSAGPVTRTRSRAPPRPSVTSRHPARRSAPQPVPDRLIRRRPAER